MQLSSFLKFSIKLILNKDKFLKSFAGHFRDGACRQHGHTICDPRRVRQLDSVQTEEARFEHQPKRKRDHGLSAARLLLLPGNDCCDSHGYGNLCRHGRFDPARPVTAKDSSSSHGKSIV